MLTNKRSAEATAIQQDKLFPQSLQYLESEGHETKGVKPQILIPCEYESISAFRYISLLWFTEI